MVDWSIHVFANLLFADQLNNMKALVYTDTQKLEYKNFNEPNLVNGESIVKVSASGICGSDMHAYHGKDNRRIPPLILGHEISGTIEKGKFAGKKVILNPFTFSNFKNENTIKNTPI